MAKKRQRFTGQQMTKEELQEISMDVTKDKPAPSRPKPKAQSPKKTSKRVEIRIPHQLFTRLDAISQKSGFSRTAIILRGLDNELNNMENR